MEQLTTRGNCGRRCSRFRTRSVARGRRRHPDHSADARPREHSADATLPERDRRGNEAGTGTELELQRPTASPGVGKLIDLVSATDCSRFVPGNFKNWLRGGDLNPRPLGYEPNELPDCSTPRHVRTPEPRTGTQNLELGEVGPLNLARGEGVVKVGERRITADFLARRP